MSENQMRILNLQTRFNDLIDLPTNNIINFSDINVLMGGLNTSRPKLKHNIGHENLFNIKDEKYFNNNRKFFVSDTKQMIYSINNSIFG